MTRALKGSLLFVHGTNTRGEGWKQAWPKLLSQLAKPPYREVIAVPCKWGPDFREGVPPPDLIRDALPEAERGVEPGPDEEIVWELLIGDPLFELRLAAVSGNLQRGSAPSDEQFATARDAVSDQLEAAGASPETFDAAVADVRQSAELSAARDAGAEVRAATARAVVAQVLNRWRLNFEVVQPPLGAVSEVRDRLVVGLARHFGVPEATAINTTDPLVKALFWFATALAIERRETITVAGVNFLADIFWYLRRDAQVRGAIRRSWETAKGHRPVVVMGHSLGGIALLDALSDPEEKDFTPDLLVTFGSQPAIFYAMDALKTIRLPPRPTPGADPAPVPPPRKLPRWLNFYAQTDLISFRAKPLGDKAEGWVDEPLRIRQPFPLSHSAYLGESALWRVLEREWPRT